jgi:hypothetical protein
VGTAECQEGVGRPPFLGRQRIQAVGQGGTTRCPGRLGAFSLAMRKSEWGRVKFIGYAHAPEAKTAEEIAAEEHNVPDTLPDRLVAIREGL